MFTWLLPRLTFLRGALFKRWFIILLGIWTAFSNFATFRDNFLSAELQHKLATVSLMNHLGGRDWLIGILAITVVALWLGAYTYNQTITGHLILKGKEIVDAKEQTISEMTNQIYALNRQLAMPELFPEIVHGPVINEQARPTPALMADFGPQKDTEIRFQLRLTNRGRARTTMSQCELVMDPNDKRETYLPDPQYGVDKTNVIEFGCPKEVTIVFKAVNTPRLQLANRPYVLRITDGTGNVSMTKVGRMT